MGRHPWLTVILATSLGVMLWGWAGFLVLAVICLVVMAYSLGRRDERDAHQAELDAEFAEMLQRNPELQAVADDGLAPF